MMVSQKVVIPVETGIQENSNYLTRLSTFQPSKYLDENILSLIIFRYGGETEMRCPEEPVPYQHANDRALRSNWGNSWFSTDPVHIGSLGVNGVVVHTEYLSDLIEEFWLLTFCRVRHIRLP